MCPTPVEMLDNVNYVALLSEIHPSHIRLCLYATNKLKQQHGVQNVKKVLEWCVKVGTFSPWHEVNLNVSFCSSIVQVPSILGHYRKLHYCVIHAVIVHTLISPVPSVVSIYNSQNFFIQYAQPVMDLMELERRWRTSGLVITSDYDDWIHVPGKLASNKLCLPCQFVYLPQRHSSFLKALLVQADRSLWCQHLSAEESPALDALRKVQSMQLALLAFLNLDTHSMLSFIRGYP